jgi:hypothetical protein
MHTMPVDPSPILMKFSRTSRGSPGDTTIWSAARNWNMAGKLGGSENWREFWKLGKGERFEFFKIAGNLKIKKGLLKNGGHF